MKKVSLVLVILAVSLLVVSQVALAGKGPLANVRVDAQCTVTQKDDGTFDVQVDAGLIQTKDGGAAPIVTHVEFVLQQHFAKQNLWQSVTSATVPPPADPFDLLPSGGRYPVAVDDFEDICGLLSPAITVDPAANAVRVEVNITVENSNKGVFTGRCISFPNPCK
jgi:hypothetical protein